MKLHALACALALLLIASASHASIPNPRPMAVSLQALGKLRIGEAIADFDRLLPEEVQNNPRGFKFYVHWLHQSRTGACLNLQCGGRARGVVARSGFRSGFLIGGPDPGLTESLGLDPTTPLLLITNARGTVRGIFRNASLEDLPAILDLLKYKVTP